MNKLIFCADETEINILNVSKHFNKISIKKILNYTLEPNNSENIINIKKLLSMNKITTTKVDIISTSESILTRTLEIPKLKKLELHKFINNNIQNYFTVNVDDFYFDYRVIKKFKKDQKDTFSILLVAVSKLLIGNLIKLIHNCDLYVDSFNVYPDCIASIFNKKNKSQAIIDIQKNKSRFTIIDNGAPFVYSIINSDFSDKHNFNEISDNFNYFLNFYSSRHFGKKIDCLYVLGETSNNSTSINSIFQNSDIKKIKPFKDINLPLNYSKKIQYGTYVFILGLLNKPKNIYNKYIDYKYITKAKKRRSNIKPLITVFLLMLILTIGWLSYSLYHINFMLSTYTTSSIDKEISSMSNIKKEVEITQNEINSYENYIKIIDDIKNDTFNYINILDTIRKGLPSNVTVKSINLNKTTVNISLNIKQNTLDVAKSVISLNKMNIFEPIQISNVALDDSVTEASFELKIKNTSGGKTNE